MGDMKRHPLADRPYLIEESGRPVISCLSSKMSMVPHYELKDLRAIEHVERLAKIGVDSLKVEGRTKSLYYVIRTAQTYRRAIDDAVCWSPI